MNAAALPVILTIGQLLVILGFYYGVIKTKLDNISSQNNEIKVTLAKLTDESTKTQVDTGKQEMLNATIEEKIEALEDRVDVHDIAIRNVEISLAKHANMGQGIN